MNPTVIRVNKRYVIVKELGRGALGLVYLAHDTYLHSRPVVIKTMLEAQDRTPNDPWLIEKFKKEIEALARINHPGVVGVFDAGQMPDGKLFFVMQYIEGEHLRSALHGRRMELKRAAHIVCQISEALSAAHEMGVIHRDLKPENIMLQALSSGKEVVKLIDFGIATVKDLRAGPLNQKTRIAGTVPYMAPEQLRGEPIPTSDIWSLGVIAYELITGRLPFYADNLLVLAELQRTGVSTLPRELCLELPVEAQEVILKALAYDPEGRYQHAHEMGEEFLRAILEAGALTKASSESTRPAQPSPPLPEDAHVLFMDLVGSSQLPMSEQLGLIRKLFEIVRKTPEYQRAQSSEQLICLHAGDGMALVFFQNPLAPVQCALEIAGELKAHPDIKLRMGLHSGPVYRMPDINGNINVSGSGINFAQRVMDSGGAGHILVSRSVADNLIQLGNWQQHLHDLGQHKDKNGVLIHLFNLCKGDVGCPNWPTKLHEPHSAHKREHSKNFHGAISIELRQECMELFRNFEEFHTPEHLRAFTAISGLELVRRCIPYSDKLDFTLLITKLLTTGRSELEPALFDLLDALAQHYREDFKEAQCQKLKEKIRNEIA